MISHNMPNFSRFASIPVSIAIALPSFSAEATEALSYNNDSELLGGAMIAPAARGEVIKVTTQWCGQAFQEMKWDGIAAYANWIRRHGEFLLMMETMKHKVTTLPNKATAAEYGKMVNEYIPKQVASIREMSLRAIQDMPVQAAQRRVCGEFIGRVATGKSDLDESDAAIAKYMRRIGGEKFEKASAARRSVFDAEPAADSIDVHALAGRWMSERSVANAEDGSQRVLAGQCAIEFTEDKVTSECEMSGKKSRIVSSYRLVGPGRYESTIVEHSVLPNLAGAVSVTGFRVVDGKLHIQAYPKRDNAPASAPVLIETTARRDEGAGAVSR